MSTLLEISSIQEIPEAKKYLIITFVEMITTWKAKKMHARKALVKWMTLRIVLIFRNQVFSFARFIIQNLQFVKFFLGGLVTPHLNWVGAL